MSHYGKEERAAFGILNTGRDFDPTYPGYMSHVVEKKKKGR